MRHERERLRLSTERGGVPDSTLTGGVDTDSPLRWNRIDTSGVTDALWEIRLRLRKEGNREKKEGDVENNKQESVGKTDGFEPFKIDDPNGENLFINQYGGNFYQNMELNRKGMEEVLKIAHLGGVDGRSQVILTSFAPSYDKSKEAQGDELAVKRFLFFGDKTQEDNPYYRVVSIPQGWRIEVNETRITEELMEKKLGGKKLQKAFVNRFNGFLKESLRECIWREKLSSEKDEQFRYKLFWDLVGGAIPFTQITFFTTNPSAVDFLWLVGAVPTIYGARSGLYYLKKLSQRQDMVQKIDPNFKPDSYKRRNIDNPLEAFMPYVEIDKVARTFAYLSGKGRKLVKEVKEEIV